MKTDLTSPLPMLSAQGLCRQYERLEKLDLSRATGIYTPHYPVTQRMVDYAQKLLPVLQAQAEKPKPNDLKHRSDVKMLLSEFLTIYAANPRELSDAQLKAQAEQTAARVQLMLSAIAEYPLWAVQLGIEGYTKTPDGRFSPKVSGELLPHIKFEFSRAQSALVKCQNIVKSDQLGLNIDKLDAKVEAAKDDEARANAALSAKNIIDQNEIGSNGLPEHAAQMYRKWEGIWREYKAKGYLGEKIMPMPNLSAKRIVSA